MNGHWRKPLSTTALVGAGALILWPIAGATFALATAAVALAVLLAHHLYNLSAFHRWLLAPRLENLPTGSGLWEQLFSYLARMMRRQAQIEAQLQEALTRFQKAGAALPEAVVILDNDHRIDWCNPKAETYFGLDLDRDRDQQVTYLIRQPTFVEYLRRSDYSLPLNLRVTPAGMTGEAILSIQMVPYGDSETLLLGRDITRWERLETTRRDFVANVSHELRTPLTVLNGFVETLSDMERPDPEMTRRSLLLMSQQCLRMNRLVEDLLTLSRLESSVAPLREETVNVPELVQNLYQDALSLSNGRHEIHLKLTVRSLIRANADEVRSAFGNLVSNAIRYTPEGGKIELHWDMRGDEGMFSVADTGIGIEAHHIDRLTERFYRVDRSRSRETGGTGLGLAIVKHVLSRHQAHLEIVSHPGEGSVFSAVFPAERMEPPAAVAKVPRTGRTASA